MPLAARIREGSISTDTLRPQDLLLALSREYKRLAPPDDARLELIHTAEYFIEAYNHGQEPEDGPEVIAELQDAINEMVTPHGFYCGTLDGDGADLGIWKQDGW